MYTPILAVLASLLLPAMSDSMDIAGLPSCAQSCLSNATSDLGSCSSVDIKCLCSNINYINALSCCLSQSCSTSDQQKALAFDTQLCNSVNVSIPNFIGCALSSSGSSGMSGISSSTATTMATMTSGMGMMTMASGTAASTLNTVEVLYTTSTGAPVARFTGGMLLEGTCTVPQIASITLGSGGTLEFPWLGCAAAAPSCCPWQNSQGGPLTICPMDYFTTANACCPSGWSIYTSAFAGQTPCYTSPPLPLVPPTSPANPSALVSTITNELFALKYDLRPPPHGLRPGAKAGIAIAALAAAFAFLAALIFCVARARNRHADATASPAAQLTADLARKHAQLRGHTMWVPPPGAGSPSSSSPPPPPPQTVQAQAQAQAQGPANELPGSTYIHEHHPAYGPGGEGYQHTSFNGNSPSEGGAPETPHIVISPLEGPRE